MAEFFLYDFVYRNRTLFRKSPLLSEGCTVFVLSMGSPIVVRVPIRIKKSIAAHRSTHKAYAYFDIAAYFNHVYQHDLVRWFEDGGGSAEEVAVLGNSCANMHPDARSTACRKGYIQRK